VKSLRLLPLLSSATEIVHALGLGEFQVGRSHECDYPPEVLRLPVCSHPSFPVDGKSAEIDHLVKDRLSQALSVYELDSRQIHELKPTHVITQTQCKVCAVSLDDVEKALQTELRTEARVIPLEAFALSGVWQDIRRVAIACGVAETGENLVAALKSQMARTEACCAKTLRRPTVAAIEWLDPLMAAGNWVPELIEMANGKNLFGAAGQHSPWMEWREVLEADPDVIIALPCGFDIARTREEAAALCNQAGWKGLKAVRSGNVFLCDGNQFMNRPGPRLVESLQIFGEIFHPELFPPTLEGIGWERFG
jgi:iron complex transport system substrate-binding protein